MVIGLALWGCTENPSRHRPDLLLITLDTTRADVLGAYGADPSPSPVLDWLAARGVRVDEAMTSTPLTLPAHSSILTGLYPDRTGVRDNMSFRLGDERVTLAEALNDEGYATGAFVSAAVLDRAFGLAQGFDAYSDGVAEGTLHLGIPRRPAEQVVADAQRWVSSVPSADPLFAWVHLYDAHRPYAPPESHLARFPTDPYLASVSSMDEQIGLLLEHLRAQGRDPLVVVVADHGEGRGEHREQTHGWFVYRSTMRVPLILSGPGVPAGQVEGPLSVVDIAPTVLELLGVDSPPGIDGHSFVPALRGESAVFNPVYGETFSPRFGFGFSEVRVLQDTAYRYLAGPQPEIYAWPADPHEEHNLVQQAPAGALVLREALSQRVETEAALPPAAPPEPGTTRMLEALGYVATVPEALEGPLPDPKSQPDMIERYDAAMIAARTRPPAEGIAVLDGFLEEFPRATPARLLLGRACLLAGEYSHGLEALTPLVEAHNPQALLLRAQLVLALGRWDEAVQELSALKRTWPSWTPAYEVLAEARRQRGDCAGAVEEATAGLALAAGEPGLLLVRGACRADQGETVEAERDLRQVLELDPGNGDVRFLLGTLLARTGRVDEALPLLVEQARMTPDRPEAIAALGLAQYELGQLPAALQTLAPVAQDPEAGAEAPLVLADALLQTGGDLDQALAHLDLAARRSPDNPQVHAVRARVLARMGRVDEARAEAERYKANAAGP